MLFLKCAAFLTKEQTPKNGGSAVARNIALKGNPLSCLTTMYDRSVIGDLYFDEAYNRHEDYIFWLTILKRGIVAKGYHKVLANYVIHSNSKNSNKSKLVKFMYRVYHIS